MIIFTRFDYITYLLDNNEEGHTFPSGQASQPGFTNRDEGGFQRPHQGWQGRRCQSHQE